MSDQSRDKIIENALAGGAIGAALGALLTGKSDRSIIAALVGAAIGASLTAQDEAKKLKMPILYESEGSLYKVYPDGRKEFVKKIPKSSVSVPSEFRLD